MDSQKERQGDFVFTAKETGEYRFCFDNDMSTFAEKMVDFEIAVRLPFPPLPPNLVSALFYRPPVSATTPFKHPSYSSSHTTGRKRDPRSITQQTRHLARTDFGAGRIHLQSFGPAINHQSQSKVLSHA